MGFEFIADFGAATVGDDGVLFGFGEYDGGAGVLEVLLEGKGDVPAGV